MKRKIPIWKWILGVILFPFVPIYLIITTKKFKLIYKVIMCIIYIAVLGFLGNIANKGKIESISINDIVMFKDEEKELELSYTPENAKTENVKCKIEDANIAEIDGHTIKAINEGNTTVRCYDAKNKKTEAIASITIKLTDVQLEEINKQKEEELKRRNNTVSDSEKVKLKDYVISIINTILKAPSTAEYPGSFLDPYNGWAFSKTDGLVTITSYVDAENSFGAKLRSTFLIQVTMNEDGTGTATYVEFDGEVYTGTMQ